MSAWRSSEAAADRGQVAIACQCREAGKSRVSEGIGRHLDLLWCARGGVVLFLGQRRPSWPAEGISRRVERLGPGSDRVAVLLVTHPGDQLGKAHGAGEVVALEYIEGVAPGDLG